MTILAIFATPGTDALGRDLLRCLARLVDVRAGAVLAHRVAAAHPGKRQGATASANGHAAAAPTAVVVLDAAVLAQVPRAWHALPTAVFDPGPPPRMHVFAAGLTGGATPGLRRQAELEAAAPDRTAGPGTVATGEAAPEGKGRSGRAAGATAPTAPVLLPSPWVVAEDLAPVPPLVRARRRRRAGLPATLVAQLASGDLPRPGCEGDDVDAVVLLGLAAAAVVDAPWLPTALALGTPTVTNATAAAQVGAEPGRHLLVAEATDTPAATAAWQDRAAALATALAADEVAATRIFREAISLRPRLDLGRAAHEVLAALGVSSPAQPLPQRDLGAAGTQQHATAVGPAGARAAARVASELATLGSLPGTPQRRRALEAVAGLDAMSSPAGWNAAAHAPATSMTDTASSFPPSTEGQDHRCL